MRVKKQQNKACYCDSNEKTFLQRHNYYTVFCIPLYIYSTSTDIRCIWYSMQVLYEDKNNLI